MTLTERLPGRVEQELAEYCTKHRLSKSEAVKLALDKLLAASAGKPSPYDLGKDLFGPHTDRTPSEDTARDSKRLLDRQPVNRKNGFPYPSNQELT